VELPVGEQAEIMTKPASYFVGHLIPGDEPSATGPFEIQVLNEVGQAIAMGYFDVPDSRFVIDGRQIPFKVSEATQTLPIGFGYYLNDDGEWVDGWGRPTIPLPTDREELAKMLLETAHRLID
jgi:hypothetical protein